MDDFPFAIPATKRCDQGEFHGAGIGDTVYAAAGGKILKIAVKDVP